MNRILLPLFLAFGVVTFAPARPSRGGHGCPPPPPSPPRWHGGHYRPPSYGWGVNVGPWGSSVSVGTRVGSHGAVGFSFPLTSPRPVVRETTTVIVQQSAAVVQQPIIVQPAVVQSLAQPVQVSGTLPAYVPAVQSSARTWVEGYWRVTRDPDGREVSRTWVPGYWE